MTKNKQNEKMLKIYTDYSIDNIDIPRDIYNIGESFDRKGIAFSQNFLNILKKNKIEVSEFCSFKPSSNDIKFIISKSKLLRNKISNYLENILMNDLVSFIKKYQIKYVQDDIKYFLKIQKELEKNNSKNKRFLTRKNKSKIKLTNTSRHHLDNGWKYFSFGYIKTKHLNAKELKAIIKYYTPKTNIQVREN